MSDDLRAELEAAANKWSVPAVPVDDAERVCAAHISAGYVSKAEHEQYADECVRITDRLAGERDEAYGLLLNADRNLGKADGELADALRRLAELEAAASAVMLQWNNGNGDLKTSGGRVKMTRLAAVRGGTDG